MSLTPDQIDQFNILKTGIDKKYGANSIRILGGNEVSRIPRLSTGIASLDEASGGGWPWGRIVEIYGPESSGKAQPLSSKVLTPSGWKLMGDLKIGDTICAPDGGNTTVVGIFPQGEQPVYRVTLDDKSVTHCTSDHLWLVHTRHTDLAEVTTTEDLLNRNVVSPDGCRKFQIPAISPLQFGGDKELPIDPYLLGLLLGDGSFVDSTIKFSHVDEELLNNISNILERDFPDVVISKKHGLCTYNLKKKTTGNSRTKLQLIIENLGLSNKKSPEKYIPEQYLYAGIQQRTRLLQGLMDTDGTVGNNGSVSFSTSSPVLSKQFEFLARSLGFKCTTSSRITKYSSSNGSKVDGLPSFRSNILVQDSSILPVSLTRKVERLNDIQSTHKYRFIESIELAGRENCQCIKVGNPDELYITDDFIVTHNTTLTIEAIVQAQSENKICAFIDVEHAFDISYASALGVDIESLVFSQPDTAEEALDIVEMLTNSGIVSLIVLDSVAALVPKKELEGEMGDSVIGLQSRLMSQAMRKLAGSVSRHNVLLFFINQIRMKIGVMFGSPETTSGGNALKFYASIRCDVRKVSTQKSGDESVANETKVKFVKNKVAPPYKVAEFIIKFGTGVDKDIDLLRVAVKKGIIKRSGTWYSYNSENIGQGEANAASALTPDTKIAKEIRDILSNVVTVESEKDNLF